MKKALLIFTAAAGMLLLGGVSAKADDATTLELKATTGGTFTANGSSSYKYKWESSTTPVITILDGTNSNDMQANSSDQDAFDIYEGKSGGTPNLTHDYTVSVADGYVITGMTVTVTTEKTDMSVTVGTVSKTLTANTGETYTMSDLWRQSVGITITSAETGNECATFSNWTVTVQEDIDLSKMKIKSIGEAITTLPVEGTWYLIENNRGNTWTPAGDTGEGNAITRASSADVVKAGDYVVDVKQYMLGFHPTALVSSTGVGSVCNLQFATGNYWVSIEGVTDGTKITTTSEAEEAGIYNVYPTTTDGNLFGLNAYDMDKAVDNNGVGAVLTGWGSGQNTKTSGNNVWVLYPLELEPLSEEEEVEEELVLEIEALIAEAQATYGNYNGGYDLNVETGFSGSDGVGNGLITENSQFSSNATDTTEGSLDNLLDNNASTYWHSDWHGSHDNGEVYLQVDMADDFVGGPLMLNFVRRNDSYNNQVTKMSVKDGDDALIDTLYLPYGSMGETVKVGFTCPYGVKKLRFYEEETEGQSQSNAGIWHVADFQLFYTYMYPDLNSTHAEAASALLSAITTAQTVADSFCVTEENIETLKTAIQTYLAALSDYEVSWTLGADYGTLILPFDCDLSEIELTAYTTSGVEDDELQLASVSDSKLSANTPYIISGTASTTPYTFTGLPAITGGLSDGYLVGNFEENFAAPVGSYVLQNQTGTPAFYLVNGDTDIIVAPYHCYLTLPDAGGNAKAVVYFPSSGVATAIEAVDGITTDSEAIYDLSGRKVTNPRSGIYIKGGKKVIIK